MDAVTEQDQLTGGDLTLVAVEEWAGSGVTAGVAGSDTWGTGNEQESRLGVELGSCI